MRVGPDHERFEDAAAAYLLGALDSEEAVEFEAHMAGCPACHAELDELRGAADALPASAPPVAPPPELKARIMAVVEREAELLAAAGDRADRPEPPPRAAREKRRGGLGFLSGLRPALAAGLAAGLIALGALGGVIATGGLGGAETVEIAFAPGYAPRASGELEVGDDASTLVASGVPQVPVGKVLQAWKVRPGQDPEPTTALFTPTRDGQVTATVPGSLDGVDQVLVTREPRGGSQEPSEAPVMAMQLS
jgi:anti-sigma-K factor RskA